MKEKKSVRAFTVCILRIDTLLETQHIETVIKNQVDFFFNKNRFSVSVLNYIKLEYKAKNISMSYGTKATQGLQKGKYFV